MKQVCRNIFRSMGWKGVLSCFLFLQFKSIWQTCFTDLRSSKGYQNRAAMRKLIVCYLSICDGGDEPSWQYTAMGSYDKTICPDSSLFRTLDVPFNGLLSRVLSFRFASYLYILGAPLWIPWWNVFSFEKKKEKKNMLTWFCWRVPKRITIKLSGASSVD